jgi:serine protease inhibitor
MMKKTLLIAGMSVALAAGLSNCAVVEPKEDVEVSIPAEFSGKTSAFAFDFWKKIHKDEPQSENYFVSPLSLHIALGMLLNGSDTQTKSEIQQVLKLDDISMEEINSSYKELIEKLPNVDPKVKNTIANSIWQEKTFPVQQSFIDGLKTNFGAQLYSEDFADPNTVKKINKWASDNTNEKIKKILDKVDADQVMFLINALYFKGDWKNQFDVKNTVKADFNGTAVKKQVDMMKREADYLYAENENYQMIELPYGNDKYAMRVILPKTDINAVVNGFNTESWIAAGKNLTQQKVNFGLPKFKIEYSKKLNEILEGMGMKTAFTDGADLSKISPPAGKIKVGFVKQDTYVAVDEKGTEAAAVTTIGVVLTSLPVTRQMLCDKPFLFVISEKTSDTILFAGKVANL